MARILMLVSDIEFDPTESCIPWLVLTDAGHDVWFASGSGRAARCDQITLTGEGLPKHLQFLAAKPENRKTYARMAAHERFQNPLSWADVKPDEFDALVLPGGHAPGVKPYIEAPAVHAIIKNFFDRKAPVSSVCHGILAAARTMGADGRSVLRGYTVTGLNNFQEKTAIKLTKRKMGHHYQTYPQSVQDEVSKALKNPRDFKSGSIMPVYGSAKNPGKGFITVDGHLLCGRWPGDVYKLAYALLAKLES